MSAPTIFLQACNAAFAPQGLALFRSLQRHQRGDWKMVWVAIGDCADKLDALAAAEASPGRLEIVPHRYVVADVPGLMDVVASREGGPYWWTWASQATHWALENYRRPTVVYLDTDCYAFADLTPAIAEVEAAGADVGLVSHRFPPHRAHMAARAHYNVGSLTTFRPTMRARMAGAAWAAMVRERCEVEDPGDDYLGIPPGRAGDQAALDAFPRFAKVHEIVDIGTGIAPYNHDGCYYIEKPNGHVLVGAAPEPPPEHAIDMGLLRLYHFHESRFDPVTGAVVKRTAYPIPADVDRLILTPYEAAVAAAAKELQAGRA